LRVSTSNSTTSLNDLWLDWHDFLDHSDAESMV
jgi:hypothetical protein